MEQSGEAMGAEGRGAGGEASGVEWQQRVGSGEDGGQLERDAPRCPAVFFFFASQEVP